MDESAPGAPGPDPRSAAADRPSPRREELLEACYAYVLEHGVAEVSLRPLARAVGSSPRVLLYLFGSKDGLVRALLARARTDEVAVLDLIRPDAAAAADDPGSTADLAAVAAATWEWLARPEHRRVSVLWLEAYARSLVDPGGPWADFARSTVEDWLEVLAAAQRPDVRGTGAGRAARTEVLALLRGALLDLLATDDLERTSAAVRDRLEQL